MRFLVVVGLVIVAAGCPTEPNPNVCCTDEADCQAKGIPSGSQCGDGLVCRGNQCIAQPCTSSSGCDLAAPYCSMERCSESCTADAECPGFGQASSASLCEQGNCVECRDASHCSVERPVCDAGTCRGCSDDAECASGICADMTGECVAEAAIAYVSSTGSDSSACTKSTPCTLARAMVVADSTRPHVKLDGASHSLSDPTFSFPSMVTFHGPGTLAIGQATVQGAGLSLRKLTLNGDISCGPMPVNDPLPTLSLDRVHVGDDHRLLAAPCLLNLSGVRMRTTVASTITVVGQLAGGSGGATVTRGSRLTIEGSSLESVGSPAIVAANYSSFTVRNSIMRNGSTTSPNAIQADLTTAMSSVSFSTIHNALWTCNNASSTITGSNNIILNELPNAPMNTTAGTSCTHRFSIIKPQSTAPSGTNNQLNADPRFVNAAAGDFHLMSGSPAIDAADPAATEAVDFDGTTRPQGAGHDIGAFEYKP